MASFYYSKITWSVQKKWSAFEASNCKLRVGLEAEAAATLEWVQYCSWTSCVVQGNRL